MFTSFIQFMIGWRCNKQHTTKITYCYTLFIILILTIEMAFSEAMPEDFRVTLFSGSRDNNEVKSLAYL